VFGIVRQAGGVISVTSEVGRGTSFRILLPTIQEPLSAKSSVNGTYTKGTETILLVEDEDIVRDLAKFVLKKLGYTVLEANGGTTAMRLARGHSGPIHLLITDVIMPENSGRILADQIRLLHPSVRVLFMSGYTEDAVLRHGIETSTDFFLQKPFTPILLAHKVREVLES
jgi:CheY-like chemotaxis protein